MAVTGTGLRAGVFIASFFIGTGMLSGCDTVGTGTEERIVEGIDLDVLFAPPQPAELEAVRNDWAQRDVSMQNPNVVAQDTITLVGTVRGVYRVVSHTVGGVRHFGAIVVPVGAAPESLPVMVYAHAGDGGENLDFTISLFSLGIRDIIEEFVYVVPSFRSETLTLDGVTYQSDGPPDTWDYDVDDALALLNTALATTPEADASRIGAFGFSRGAGVAMLMAIRDQRIDLVSEFFGPTDFSAEDMQETTADALRGTLRDLPGLNYLDATFIQPLKEGTISMQEARIAFIRRSPVFFAEELPAIQIQHGEADQIVSVEHAQILADRLRALGHGPDMYELHLYPGAGHNPIEMVGSFDRMIGFVSRLLR